MIGSLVAAGVRYSGARPVLQRVLHSGSTTFVLLWTNNLYCKSYLPEYLQLMQRM